MTFPNTRFFLVLMLFVLIGCKKEDIENTDPSEKVKGFVIYSQDNPATGSPTGYFNVLNADVTMRWRKPATFGAFYGNGKLYMTEVLTGGGKFYATDINTGAVSWSFTTPGWYMNQMIYRNDTLFCSLNQALTPSTSIGYIAAYDAKTGAEYWKQQITTNYWPYGLVLDGNTLVYYLTLSTGINVQSFNLSTRTINWTAQHGASLMLGSPSNLLINADKVFVRTVNQNLVALNRNTGAVVWTLTGYGVRHPIYYNNMIITECTSNPNFAKEGLYSFDASTGSLRWKWESNSALQTFGAPFAANGKVVFTSSNFSEFNFIKTFDVNTGQLLWSTVGSDPFEVRIYPIIFGDRIYTFNKNSLPTNFTARIFSYDLSNGQARDSLVLPVTIQGFTAPGILGSDEKLYFPN